MNLVFRPARAVPLYAGLQEILDGPDHRRPGRARRSDDCRPIDRYRPVHLRDLLISAVRPTDSGVHESFNNTAEAPGDNIHIGFPSQR